jgi:hypothetical protein
LKAGTTTGSSGGGIEALGGAPGQFP